MKKPFRDETPSQLLADIFDDTEQAASREREARTARIDSMREAKQERAETERQRRLAERQAKLEAELERQRRLQEAREAKMAALRADELRSEVEADEIETRSQEISVDLLAPRVEAKLSAQTSAPPTLLEVPEPRANRSYVAMAVAAVMAIGIGAVAIAATTIYTPDHNTYAKAVFAPKTYSTAMTEVALTAVPRAEPAAPTLAGASAERPKLVRKPVADAPKPEAERTRITSKPRQNEANEALGRFGDLTGADPFALD